jgi:serine O-acetyltransferase
MQLSLTSSDFRLYTCKQLNTFYPDSNSIAEKDLEPFFGIAIDRIDACFKNVAYNRYNKNNQTFLNHLYIDHYLMFVWFLANTIWKEEGDTAISTKLYYLNKTLHSFDCMYDTALPNIFLVFHGGTGTLLGKAQYDDFFVALHGCTVGSHKGKYPKIGKGVALTAHSSIIGDCSIGDRVSISSNTSIFQKDIPADSVAFIDRENGKLTIKPSKTPYSQQFFNVTI